MGTSKSSQATDFSNAVNAELRSWMGRRGVTQTELSELTGMSQAKISKTIRNDQGSLTLDQLEAVCTALKVDISSVIERAEQSLLTQNKLWLAARENPESAADINEEDYL